MEKEKIVQLASLFTAMQETVAHLQQAYEAKDAELLAHLKTELLTLQKQAGSLL